MKNKHTAFILSACLLSVFAAAPAASAEYTPTNPEIVSVRLSAMGGPSPAMVEGGIDTLSTNPAAFAFEKKKLRIIGINAALSGQFMDAADIINAESTQAVTDAVLDYVRKNNGVYFGLNMTGPLSVAYVAKNFGFGVFNRTYASADVASITSGDIFLGEELLVTGAFGFKIIETKYHELALGIQAKLFFQAESSQTGTISSLVESLMNFSLDNQPVNSALGAGFDLGLLYRFAGSLSVGVVCKDVYTPVFYRGHDSFQAFLDMEKSSSGTKTLDRDLQVGVAWKAPIPRSWHTVTNFTVAAGFSDILSAADPTARNPVLNVSIGLEATFFHILSLRAGIRETYPAIGLGLDLKVFQLDLAVYGSELGMEPGERGVYNMALGVAFGF